MLEKISFEAVETPVIYDFNGEKITSKTHKVIMKDSGEQLSVMSTKYNLMKTEDFMETTEKMSQISGFKISGYSEINDGRIIISHLKNEIQDLNINGHKIDDYLVIGTSFDGSHPFFIGTSTVLLRCQNQFSKLAKATKIRHTESSPRKREELLQDLEKYFMNRKQMYENFNEFIKIKVDPKIREMAINYILNVDKQDILDENVSTRKLNQMEKLREDIMIESADMGNNLWSLFNGVTKYTTHSIASKEENFGNLFGTKNYLNSKAYKFASELIDN